nr:unnamed protein product [Spirometra erinaceieuropaei]
MKVSGVRLHCLVLLLALFIFVAEVQAVGICDWDMRTYTTQKGSVHLRTVRSGRYGRGYIGEVPFAGKWFSRTTCYLGDVEFRCVYADDRFVVDEDMHLTKCPKYKQTTLVWKFPGTVQTRGAFECFRGDVRLCRGTTIKNETGKCVVTVVGQNLIHTLTVKEPRGEVEFFYCRLSPATPYRALTYNVDWRYAQPIPLEATTTETAADMKPTPPMEDKKNDPKEQNATPPGNVNEAEIKLVKCYGAHNPFRQRQQQQQEQSLGMVNSSAVVVGPVRQLINASKSAQAQPLRTQTFNLKIKDGTLQLTNRMRLKFSSFKLSKILHAQPIPPEGKPAESAADVQPVPPNGIKNNPKEPGAIPPVAPPKQGNTPYDRQQPEIMIAHTTSDARRLTACCRGAIVLLVVTLGGNL